MIAYRCRHSGKYLPEEWVKEWGRHPGTHGLGPVPCSPCLDTLDYQAPAKAHNGELMLPMGFSYAALDMVNIKEEEFEANKLILPNEDEAFYEISLLLQQNQRVKRQRRAADFAKEMRTTGGKIQ
ncbi:MAG: hypothetical protein ACREH5_06190 [Candidatus Omnitrophota bacterium]